MEAAVTRRRTMTRITTRIMMRTKKRMIVLPPATRSTMRMKITMRITMKTRTRRNMISPIPGMKRKRMKIMRKRKKMAGVITVAVLRAAAVPTEALPAEVHPAGTGGLPVAAAAAVVTDGVLLPWIATGSARSPAKADALIMKKEAPSDMMNAGADQAAADVPVEAVAPAAVLPGAVQAEAHPAEAAAVLPAGAATRGNPVTQEGNSPAVADAQAMAAVRATAADVQVAAAAPAEGNPSHDFFHKYKQIGLVNALFVCFLTIY
jgi:hypothetical protein